MADPFTFEDEYEEPGGAVLEEVPEAAAPLDLDEDDPNLVFAMQGHPEGDEFLRDAADNVLMLFESGWEAASDFRDQFLRIWKFYGGDLPEKHWPFENAANASVPILMENTTRLVARILGEVFGNFRDFMHVIPVGPDDEGRAEILTKHDNWQIAEEIPDFRRQMRRMVTSFFLTGDVTIHSFYDSEREQNRHEVLTPAEFVVPQTDKTTMPDYSDVPWRAKILPRHKWQLQKMRHRWANVDQLLDELEPDDEDKPEDNIDREINRVSGLLKDYESDAPYTLIQWEGWHDLPGYQDQRFLQVIVDYNTKIILALKILEEPRWRDQLRYDMQMAQLASYRSQMQTVSEARQEIESANAQLTDAMVQGAIDPESAVTTSEQMDAHIPDEPVPPEWLQDPTDPEELPPKVKKDPVNLFYHLVCLEPLRGALGIPYGRTQSQFNKAANILLSQFVDAATLGNIKGWFASGNVDIPEPVSVEPGKIKKIPGVEPGELKNSIMELNLGNANPQMREVIDMIWGWAQSSMQSPSVLSGEPGKSGETFRGLSSRIEQASQQLSQFGLQIIEAVEAIMKNNAKLNSIYLPDDQIVQVMNHKLGQMEELQMGRKLYQKGYNTQFSADTRFISKSQKIAEADELLAFYANMPELQGNPTLLVKLIELSLKARGREHLLEFFQPNPANLQPPPQGGGGPAPPP